MIRITFINGSYYCEPGKTKLKLKGDSFYLNSKKRRLRIGEIVTFLNIHEDVHGKWIKVRTENYQFYDISLNDLIFQKNFNLLFCEYYAKNQIKYHFLID